MKKFFVVALAIGLVFAAAYHFEETDERILDLQTSCKTPCCQSYKNFKCPKTEAETLRLIWNAANGGKWKHRGGWEHFHHDDCKKWKKVCAPAGAYPDGDYYDAYSPYHGVTCKHGYVVELDLSDNNLKGCISPAIGCLKYVKVVDLSGNDLKGCVPHTIGWLDESLMELYLDDNKLIKATKDICAFAPQCKKLTLDSNPWKQLPKCIAKMAKKCKYGVDL